MVPVRQLLQVFLKVLLIHHVLLDPESTERAEGRQRTEWREIIVGTMPNRLTLKTVNDELTRLGRQERLAKAGNYFLFTGGVADEWLDRTVGVRTIGSKTLKEWIAEFQRLKALNDQILGTVRKTAKGGRKA
jgi:hypothetical protein